MTYILCRKLLPAFLASLFDNESATLCLHSLAESMRLLAPVVVRLICPFHLLHLQLFHSAWKAFHRPFRSDNYVKLYLFPPCVSTTLSLFSKGFSIFSFFFQILLLLTSPDSDKIGKNEVIHRNATFSQVYPQNKKSIIS